MATTFETWDEGAPATAPTARIPDAVWINRPVSGPRRAAKAFAIALLLGLAAVAAKYAATETLVPSAVAGTEAAAGDAPSGYFPAQFDYSRLVPGDLPPTF
jgi:hypothetical protein